MSTRKTPNAEHRTPNTPTIFALATPAYPSPVALIRVSGPLVPRLCGELFGIPCRRGSHSVDLKTAPGVVPAQLWVLPAPRTLTGDDTLEVLVPGNLEIVRELEELLRRHRCRDAEPGEFTRRALDAGKLDLSKAEAVLRLVNAGDEAARKQAVNDMAGDTAAQLRALAENLRAVSARFEMLFDFGEEEHADAEEPRLRSDLDSVRHDLRQLVSAGEMHPHRDRPVVALFGPPNAGKSTLFNALLGKPRALVSDTPGTTRDPVESEWRAGSHDALLVDLSGVGHADADRGRFAETARERALEADVLLVLDAPAQDVAAEFRELERRDASVRARAIWVHTKTDIERPALDNPPGIEGTAVSALSGGGLEELRSRVVSRLAELASGGATSLMHMRGREALSALEDISADMPFEGAAGEVRHALRLLDEALVSEAPGEVLDLIFSRFCIGK